MGQLIYLLPGRGGHSNQGLGEELRSRGYQVVGRELVGDFERLPFGEQIELVASDLRSGFWHKDARVVANSFGAYLFLHAQTIMPPYVGRVLLLSPIVGEAANEATMSFFVPPRARRLQELAKAGTYPAPACCEIHVGENDWQSNPANLVDLAGRLGIRASVVPGAGHQLEHAVVRGILDRWLPLPS
jgi:hypothetical protein